MQRVNSHSPKLRMLWHCKMDCKLVNSLTIEYLENQTMTYAQEFYMFYQNVCMPGSQTKKK